MKKHLKTPNVLVVMGGTLGTPPIKRATLQFKTVNLRN